MRCYRCEARLSHVFHDDGTPTGDMSEVGLHPEPGGGETGNRPSPMEVGSSERITDELVRSMYESD